MQKIIFGETTRKEFLVNSLIQNETATTPILTIEFDSAVTYSDVATVLDGYNNPLFSKDTLRRMEVYNQVQDGAFELQGIHIGFCKPMDISVFNGVVKAKIQKESDLELRVAELESKLII